MNHSIWLSSLCVFVPSLFTTRMCSCVFYNFSLQSALVLDANIQSCTICLNFLIVVSSNQITKIHFVQVAISSFCKKKKLMLQSQIILNIPCQFPLWFITWCINSVPAYGTLSNCSGALCLCCGDPYQRKIAMPLQERNARPAYNCDSVFLFPIKYIVTKI